MSRQSQLTEALRRGDIVTYERLAARNDRWCDFIRGAVGVAAAGLFILAVLLTANAALGATPSPAIGQLAAWNTDTAPLVSVPSPVQEATPAGVLDGGGGGRVPGDVRSTGSAPAPEVSPSDPPPPSGPDDGVGEGDAPIGDDGDGETSAASPSLSPPLDEIWTCDDIPLTAGVATWANLGTSYADLTADPACHRGGPRPDENVDSPDVGSGPPPTTITPPYEGPVVLCEHPDIGSGTHIGTTCPDGWTPLGEPTVRTTTTTTVYVGPVIYCEHPQIGSGGFRAEACPDGWTEMTS